MLNKYASRQHLRSDVFWCGRQLVFYACTVPCPQRVLDRLRAFWGKATSLEEG